MSVGTKIVENTTVILVARLFNTGLGLATVYVLTRFLGPAEYGVYMTVFAYVTVMGNLVEFGFRPMLIREMSQQRESVDELAGNVMVVKLMAALLVVSGLSLSGYVFMKDLRTFQLLLIYSLSLFLLVPVFESTFAAHLQVKVPSLLRTLQRTLLLVLILAVAYAGGNLLHIILVELLAGLFYMCSGYLLAARYLRPRFRIDLSIWKKVVVASWPLGLFLILDHLLHRIDIIVLSMLEGQASVGIYSLAARLTQFLEVFVAALMVSVFPLLCRYYGSDEERFQALWRLSYKYLMSFIVLVALVVSFVAGPLTTLLGGEAFEESAIALQVLVWSQIFFYGRSVSANLFMATGQRRLVVGLALGTLIGNTALDFLLIPYMGYMGACWGTLISYAVVFPLAYLIKEARTYVGAFGMSLMRPAVAGVVAYILTIFLGLEGPIRVVTAATIYCGVLVLLKGITREDIQIVKGIYTGEFNWRSVDP